jgi:hypothetical protein
MKVRPARAGDVIRFPESAKRLPDEGALVPETSFWMRRLRSGDVVLVEGVDLLEPAPIPPLTTREN